MSDTQARRTEQLNVLHEAHVGVTADEWRSSGQLDDPAATAFTPRLIVKLDDSCQSTCVVRLVRYTSLAEAIAEVGARMALRGLPVLATTLALEAWTPLEGDAEAPIEVLLVSSMTRCGLRQTTIQQISRSSGGETGLGAVVTNEAASHLGETTTEFFFAYEHGRAQLN